MSVFMIHALSWIDEEELLSIMSSRYWLKIQIQEAYEKNSNNVTLHKAKVNTAKYASNPV